MSAPTRILACALGALALSPTAAAAARGAPSTERLSDERTLTRWAHTNVAGPVRSSPGVDAATIDRLRWRTEDGLPEVYLVLRAQLDDRGARWLQVRLPGRPNGRKGWVRADRLSALKVVRTQLVVDRRRLRATLRRDGRVIWSSPVGVGAPGTPTPGGHFWIRERLRNLAGDPLYGPWAFATSAYSDTLTDWPGGGVIGVHGTDAPQLIPGRISHGCVRVPNAAIRRLARLMPVGTPVLIR